MAVRKVRGVLIGKVDEETLDIYLKHFRVEVEGDDIPSKVDALVQTLEARKEKMGLRKYDPADCDTCGAESPGSLPKCPFCGDSEMIEVEPKKEKPVATKKKTTKKKTTKKKTTKKKAPKKKTTKKKAPKKKTTKKKAPKKRSDAKKKSTEIATTEVVDVTPAKYKESDLDMLVDEARECMIGATEKMYQFGKVLARISDKNLYLLRRAKKGMGPKYTTFKQFVREEFGISHTQAYRLIAVANHFTPAQIQKVGAKKLHFVLTVPEDARSQVLASAEAGETMKQMSAKASALTGKEKVKKPQPRTENSVTAVFAIGIQESKMFKAPTKATKVGAPGKPATKLSEQPYAVFSLENDVAAIVRVFPDADGHLECALEFKRGVVEVD